MIAAVRAWLDKATHPISRRAATDTQVRELIGLSRSAALRKGRIAVSASDALAVSTASVAPACADALSSAASTRVGDLPLALRSKHDQTPPSQPPLVLSITGISPLNLPGGVT